VPNWMQGCRQSKKQRNAVRALAALAALLVAAPAYANEDVRIGTASAHGVYYPAGGAICRLVNRTKNDHGLRCTVESSIGSLANLQALQKGTLDFAVMQSDAQYQALHGDGNFSGKADHDLRAVFSLYAEAFTVLVRADSPMQSFDQVRTARLNLGPENSAVRAMAREIFQLSGWNLSDAANISSYSIQEQAKALCDGVVDVIFYTSGHPNGAVQQATSRCDMRLLPIDGDTAKRLFTKAPYFTNAVIPGGMYAGNPKEVHTIGVQATLVTRKDTPDATVEAVVRSVFANLTNFKTLHPVFARLEPRLMVRKGLTAPLHAAAKRYYEQAGLLPKTPVEAPVVPVAAEPAAE
jgi:TRAP transporter TAXI family solute receptor